MADIKKPFSGYAELTSVADDDIVMMTDVSDKSQSANGTSKQAKAATLAASQSLATSHVKRVTDLAALRALTGMQANQTVEMVTTGRAGLFRWDSSNLAAQVTADTQMGIYVPPTGQDGSSGAWVRVFDGPARMEWFGATGDGSTNDYSAFLGVSPYLGESSGRYVELKPSTTYYLSFATKMLFTRLICREGVATVIIDGGGELGYLSGASDERFELQGLDVYVVGGRNSEDDDSNTNLYDTSDSGTEISVCRIERCRFFGITSAADLTSWSDDVGKTRHPGVLWVKASSSTLRDIDTFGMAVSFVVLATAGAKHEETNIRGYNCQTLLWLYDDGISSNAFDRGVTKNIEIINTEAQQDYWIGKNIGRLTNGMNTLLLDAAHGQHIIDGLHAERAIERSGYLQGDNIVARNITDVSSATGVHVKNGTAIMENNQISGVSCRDGASFQDVSFYGQRNLLFSDFSLASAVHDSSMRSISFLYELEDISIRQGIIRESGVAFYIANLDAGKMRANMRIEDISLHNVYAGLNFDGTVLATRPADNSEITRLLLKNITHNVDSPTTDKFARAAYNLRNMSDVRLENVEGWADRTPFRANGASGVHVFESRFFIASDSGLSTVITRMQNDADFLAEQFSFMARCAVNAESIPASMDIVMERLSGSDMVNPFEYWKEITVDIQLPANAAVSLSLPIEAYSWGCTATLGSSQLQIINDGETEASTETHQLGSRISHTDQTTAYRVFAGAAGLNVVTDATTLPGGTLRLVISR